MKQKIIEWLKKVGTKEDLQLVEIETYYQLYKIAYWYNFNKYSKRK